jgi:predicted amidophosphoribosyltransferase
LPSIYELTDPFISTYTFVPPAGAGVCEICHGPVELGYSACFNCYQTRSQVRRPTDRVVPISLCENLSHFHYVMRMYKDGRNEEVRGPYRQRIAATLARFLKNHRVCLGDWDLLTTIPSGKGRQGEHPLVQAMRLVESLWEDFAELLTGRATPPPSHNQARDDAYEVTEEVNGTDILIIDDTFTTGAAAQSAASALQTAGARVVAVVPVARYVKPAFSDAHETYWEAAIARDFSFDVCCLE